MGQPRRRARRQRSAPSLRAELGAHWAKRGQRAYASIAALARFSLDLLALGAPPDLVASAQAAMGDKLEHARLCFGLATALGGRPVGPGPLAVRDTPEGSSLTEVVKYAVTEGCVGETLAALGGAEALTRASDRAVCEVSTKVGDDERWHAELAWRFVRWALDGGGDEAHEAAFRHLTSISSDNGTNARLDLRADPSELRRRASAPGRALVAEPTPPVTTRDPGERPALCRRQRLLGPRNELLSARRPRSSPFFVVAAEQSNRRPTGVHHAAP